MSLNLRAGTDSSDEAISDEYGAVFYDVNIGERSTTAGSAAAQS